MPLKTKEEQREYQRKWMAQRRQEWIDLNGPCKNCDSWDDLEVDHINPLTKTMNPSQIWSRKQEIRDEELAKCQVLCEDCHKEKSKFQISLTHKDNSGENNPSSKLTKEDVEKIRKLYNTNLYTQKELGIIYKVHRTMIGLIVRNKNWSI